MKPFFRITIVLGLFAFGSARALAASGCGLEISAAALRTAQNGTSSDAFAALKSELDARKRFLSQVLSCAIDDASRAQQNLSTASTSDRDISIIRGRLSERLTQTIGYYKIQMTRVPDLGIAGTQELASEVRDWRNIMYAPLIQSIANVELWINDQSLFEHADARLRQVQHEIQSQGLLSRIDIQSALDKAQLALREAETTNDTAKDSLWGAISPGDSLGKIRESLAALSDTYAYFFELSDAVKAVPKI